MTIKSIMNHVATRAVLAVAVAAAGIGGLYGYAQTHGGFLAWDETPIVYLSDGNIASTLSLKPGKSAKDITAAPALPVLLIECPRVACESSDLNLRKLTKELDGKVIVLALDPYDNKQFSAAVEKLFINDQLQQNFAINLAMQMVQSSGQQPSKELLMSVLQDPQFQQLLARQAKSASIMQSVYPKVFVFGAKDFHLLAAVTGVATHDDLLGLVKKVVPAAASAASTPGDDSASADDPLSQAAPADAETAPADAASATPTPPAAPNGTAPATAAPAAPQSGKQP